MDEGVDWLVPVVINATNSPLCRSSSPNTSRRPVVFLSQNQTPYSRISSNCPISFDCPAGGMDHTDLPRRRRHLVHLQRLTLHSQSCAVLGTREYLRDGPFSLAPTACHSKSAASRLLVPASDDSITVSDHPSLIFPLLADTSQTSGLISGVYPLSQSRTCTVYDTRHNRDLLLPPVPLCHDDDHSNHSNQSHSTAISPATTRLSR